MRFKCRRSARICPAIGVLQPRVIVRMRANPPPVAFLDAARIKQVTQTESQKSGRRVPPPGSLGVNGAMAGRNADGAWVPANYLLASA